MTQLLRFDTADGGSIYVEAEVTEPETGHQRASLTSAGDRVIDVHRRFGEALSHVRDAATEVLGTFRQGNLDPDAIEIEFGVRLTVEAGAVIAKTAAEGNLTLRLRWTNPHAG
jgi:Trypsin-co-occurring domain 1